MELRIPDQISKVFKLSSMQFVITAFYFQRNLTNMRLHILTAVVLIALFIDVDSSVPFEKRLIKDFEPKGTTILTLDF